MYIILDNSSMAKGSYWRAVQELPEETPEKTLLFFTNEL
jgi:hypothetical protein